MDGRTTAKEPHKASIHKWRNEVRMAKEENGSGLGTKRKSSNKTVFKYIIRRQKRYSGLTTYSKWTKDSRLD